MAIRDRRDVQRASHTVAMLYGADDLWRMSAFPLCSLDHFKLAMPRLIKESGAARGQYRGEQQAVEHERCAGGA